MLLIGVLVAFVALVLFAPRGSHLEFATNAVLLVGGVAFAMWSVASPDGETDHVISGLLGAGTGAIGLAARRADGRRDPR